MMKQSSTGVHSLLLHGDAEMKITFDLNKER